MALILPEVKHEYIFKEDTEEQKQTTFEQCLDEGKEAAYASIGTEPLDSTYIGAPDILPEHIMEYTSTDDHDYLKTIELVWGYTIGIITTKVILNKDTGDILAEGDAVDNYVAPEDVNTATGRWIRLSGNRNLHPTILRAVEMPEDVICLKDLCAAVQIDSDTGFTIEGFDSSHVINFDNAFQKAYINNEVTFDMSSCKTCKYMFNEGLIKNNSGELLTIQNMQPGTNCDYMFYNSYLYKVPEGIRQAGVGGVGMFWGSALGKKSGVDMNTGGYKGKLYSKMFCGYDNMISGTNVDTQHNNELIDTQNMVFDSTDSNIDLALNYCKGIIPQINYTDTVSAKQMYYDKSNVEEITVDLSTATHDMAATLMFGGDNIAKYNIIGNPENTRLYYEEVDYGNYGTNSGLYSLIRPKYNSAIELNITVNITNTLYFYQYEDVIQGTVDSITRYTLALIHGGLSNPTKAELTLIGNIYALTICSKFILSNSSNIIVKQYHLQSLEEFERFYQNTIINGNNYPRNVYLIDWLSSNYDEYFEEFINTTNLSFINLDDCFFIDRIFNNSIGMNLSNRGYEDNTIELNINLQGKSFCITQLYNVIKNINVTNAGLGFMYFYISTSIYNTSSVEDYNEDLMMKSLVSISGDGGTIYYRYVSGSFDYRKQYYSWQFVDAPEYDIEVTNYINTLLLKSIGTINNIVDDEYCTIKGDPYPFSNRYEYSNIYTTLLAVDSIKGFNSNQIISVLGITENFPKLTLHSEVVNSRPWYICPAVSFVKYDKLCVIQDISYFQDFPEFNIVEEDYALYAPIQINALNVPISLLSHFSSMSTNRGNLRLSAEYPLNSFYTLKQDVDSVNVQISKYGANSVNAYFIYPSVFEITDLSRCTIGDGYWGNDSMTVSNSYYTSEEKYGIYVPNFNSISVNILTRVPVLNTEINISHERVSNTNSRLISIKPSVTDAEGNYVNGAPNLTTINFTGYSEYSLEVDLAHQRVESNLTTINWVNSYINGNGNVDLRWSQGIDTQTLSNLTNLQFRGSGRTVTINTIPYKLFTSEQIATLSSKVTLNEYIPQEA